MRHVELASLLLAGLAVACAPPSSDSIEMPAAEDSAPFLEQLPGWGRYIVLAELDRVLPVYLEETSAVIEAIDALPPGAVEESTKLDEIPIDDLFNHGQVALSTVMDEAAFNSGRRDHDVAWLRQSAAGLELFAAAVDEAIASGADPADFDVHLTNSYLWQGESGALEINAGVRAVSRYYCNLDVRITDGPSDGFRVETGEYCD